MIVADTGPLVAMVNSDDAHHQVCVDLFDRLTDTVVVPAPVIVEVCWLLARRAGPHVEATFLASLAAGDPRVEPLAAIDYQRAAELVETYADMDLGFVDASVVAVAERLNVATVATINTRDFHVLRPAHVDTFTLIP